MKRFFKKLFIFIFLFCYFCYCFKGVLYRSFVTYSEINQRQLVRIESQAIKADLDIWLKSNPSADEQQLIKFATQYATKDVSYTFGKCSTNPNTIICETKKTNCVGYSASLHAVLVYLIDKKGWHDTLICAHKVAQLYCCGINVHHFFRDPAFKDHDYNVVTNLKTKQLYVIDPTVYAYFGVENVREKGK